MKITTKQINNAIENGYQVEVIINGESYELDKLEDFTDGVKFAAAILEDRRARSNSLFEGYKTIAKKSKPVTKKACEINAAKNKEIADSCKFLEDIITGASFKYWLEDYKGGKLWHLKKDGV